MAALKPSAESDVFRELYARLKDGIQADLKAIAADLYSRKLISKGTSNSATNLLLDSESRAISLLNAIEEKIMINGSVFWEFLEILEVHRKNLAAELREEFKNKSEQCDGVSEDPDLSVPIEPAQERKEASSRYVPSITVSNRTALTGQCSPQPPSSNRDLPEQAPLRESGTMSPALLVGSNSLKPLLAQLGESDGNEESRGITTLTSAATAAALEHSYGYVSEVQGDGGDDKKLMKVDQAYARMERYYQQELKRTVQRCKKLEHDLKSTRDELKHLNSKLQGQDRALQQKDSELQEMRQRKDNHLHEKETEHLKGQIESGKKDVLYMVRESRLKHSELDQTLREKDTELQEMKQKLVDQHAKLMERDDHLRRVEAELSEVKAQLQQKEMELQQKEMELQQKEQENKLLKYQLDQGVIKQKLLLCERIRELVHQVIKVRNVQEIQDIRQQIEKIIDELKASVGRRKCRSWYM